MTKATPYTRTTLEGDILTVARPEEIGASTEDGKWVTFCEKHQTLVYSETKRLALDTRGKDFCDACRADEPASNTDGWVEHSTPEVADMSEVFAAQEEADAATDALVKPIRDAVEAGDRKARNAAI